MKLSTRNRAILCLPIWFVLTLLGAALRASSLPTDELGLITCAKQLHSEVGERIWPGWSAAPFDVLLIDGETEYLICPPASAEGFTPIGRDQASNCQVMARERSFPPNLLATFPAVGGVPTIVVGTPEATGKSPLEWMVTVLHEHFHQFEYSRPGYYDDVAALGLSGGDQTGSWMLNYPFPYDDPAVQQHFDVFASALANALAARDSDEFPSALRTVKSSWRAFREALSPADYTYFEFQVWQEGVARYIELRLAEELAAHPVMSCLARFDPEALKALPGTMRDRIDGNLRHPALNQIRRVAFYSVGAAIAQILDETSPAWKQEFLRDPFEVDRYFAP
jgi:hypothetical protein